ncbi:DUF4878 domain-containing protein [Acinetobacter sp. LoGeW2-3]|uniref:DUF4878 domain-containing protein n=1 Tax=Acinetobacter sp. LoGeW2-3 TaxID=1808001 RepID=UPI00148A6B62|nr:DUF4878 domain-containing protein [Acinetobacter sp. LoGeW2-3]
MKTKLMLLAGLSVLAGCSNNAKQVPDPSAAQVQAAEIAYKDLRDGKYEEFLSYLDPKLQQYFQENQKTMKKFSHSIPEGEYKSKTLMVKTFVEGTGKLSEYKVSYEIAYPNNLVQYDVSFDKPNGSAKIQNFYIRVYGE